MSHKPPTFIGAGRRPAALLVLMLLVGAACGGATTSSSPQQDSLATPAEQLSDQATNADETTVSADDESDAAGTSPAPGSNLASLITELPAAPIGLPTIGPPDRQPIGLTIEALDVEDAAIIGVGVEDNGDMEIPPADQVGWYEYGPTPGAEGSAVLAAHIAYDGQDGVFVTLDRLELGSVIEVSYDDGSTSRFEAVSKEQYEKAQLPRDNIFARDGSPQLVLITCGGDFNRGLRSYEDNVVIYANPLV